MKRLVINMLALLLLLILLMLTKAWKFIISEEIINQKIYIKSFSNDDTSKRVTVFLHIKDASHDEFSTIYIIPGTFHYSDYPPDVANYISFPESTGVYVEWTSKNDLLVCASRKPEINTFSLDDVNVNLVIDRYRLDTIEKEGKDVIWYKIRNPDVYQKK